MKAHLRLALLGASVVAAQPAADPQTPVFGARVDSVFIDAFVTRGGTSIRGLTARDFVLKDNGVAQPFDLVPVDSLPIRALLVLDTSSSMSGTKLQRLGAAALSFLTQLRPQDEAGLVSFSDEILWRVPLTTDRAVMTRALSSLEAQGATSIYDALFTALIMPGSASRTLVVLFTDGEDNMSWLSERQVLHLVERSNALIHFVAARSADFESGFVARSSSEADHARLLRRFAKITGGSVIEVDSPERIEAAFSQIIERMKNRYVIRYTALGEPSPGWRKLELKLVSMKGDVKGRTGYWVEKR